MEENSLKKVGRGKRGKQAPVELGEIIQSPRRPYSKVPLVSSPSSHPPPTSPPPPTPPPKPTSSSSSATRTSSRTLTKIYLLDKTIELFSLTKLPKNFAVLQRFLAILETAGSPKAAAKLTTAEVKIVWKHHFGLKLVYGVQTENDNIEVESNKLVIMDNKIDAMILALHKEWLDLERTTRRKDRCKKEFFKLKQKHFLEDTLETPLNISKANSRDIFEQKSGILEWAEDYTHLQNQLPMEQKGSVAGFDIVQKRLEEQRVIDQQLADEEYKMIFDNNNLVEDSLDEDEEVWWEESKKDKKRKKADVMGMVSGTGDRLGMSCRQKAMFAASVCNATQVPLTETNISKTTAWRRGQEERVKNAKAIRDEFVKPEYVVVYWDVKIMKLQNVVDV